MTKQKRLFVAEKIIPRWKEVESMICIIRCITLTGKVDKFSLDLRHARRGLSPYQFFQTSGGVRYTYLEGPTDFQKRGDGMGTTNNGPADTLMFDTTIMPIQYYTKCTSTMNQPNYNGEQWFKETSFSFDKTVQQPTKKSKK